MTYGWHVVFACARAQVAEKAFGNLPKTGNRGDVERAKFMGADYRHVDDSLSLAHVAIAVEGASWTSPHAFPLMIAQTLLGSWDRTTGAGNNVRPRARAARRCVRVGCGG